MIDGFAIGHHTADGPGWLTGVTVIVAPPEGAVGGVAVRGGGPGTRETDLLDPTALVERAHAVVLTGGSAYGLASADGVMAALERDGIGFPVGPEPGQVVPVVPAAVIFDLGRGGDFRHRPSAASGAAAYAAASTDDPDRGCVGAGTGAVCGGLKGGFGYAEHGLPTGGRIAAAVVVNATGSAVDHRTGRLWADPAAQLPAPMAEEVAALRSARESSRPSLATTIGAVLTDHSLTKTQAARVASVAHDGMARAVHPIHSMLDGDTAFALASGRRGPLDLFGLDALLAAAADVFTAACLDAMTAARSCGPLPSYRSLAPSVFGGAASAS